MTCRATITGVPMGDALSLCRLASDHQGIHEANYAAGQTIWWFGSRRGFLTDDGRLIELGAASRDDGDYAERRRIEPRKPRR